MKFSLSGWHSVGSLKVGVGGIISVVKGTSGVVFIVSPSSDKSEYNSAAVPRPSIVRLKVPSIMGTQKKSCFREIFAVFILTGAVGFKKTFSSIVLYPKLCFHTAQATWSYWHKAELNGASRSTKQICS